MKQVLAIFIVIGLLAFAGEAAFAMDYVGSDQCFSCHTAQYNDWQASGHPWKLQKRLQKRATQNFPCLPDIHGMKFLM